MRKIIYIASAILCILLAASNPAAAQGSRIMLTQLEKAPSTGGIRKGKLGVSNSAGDQRYTWYVNVADTCINWIVYPTGNTTMIDVFVQRCSSDSIWYIDDEGRSMLISSGGGGGAAHSIYTASDTAFLNLMVTINNTATWRATDDVGGKIPFTFHVEGNEPEFFQCNDGADSLVFKKSDVEYIIQTPAPLRISAGSDINLESTGGKLVVDADSLQIATVPGYTATDDYALVYGSSGIVRKKLLSEIGGSGNRPDSTFALSGGAYWGKSITSDVYRTTGTITAGSATTQDSALFKYDPGTKKLSEYGFFTENTGNGFFMKPGTVQPNSPPFGLALSSTLNPDGTYNHVYTLQLNRRSDAQKFSSEKTIFGDKWECDWQNAQGKHVYERHFAYNDSIAELEYRPLTGYFFRDGTYSSWGSNTDLFYFKGREHQYGADFKAQVIINNSGQSQNLIEPLIVNNDTSATLNLTNIDLNAAAIFSAKTKTPSLTGDEANAIIIAGTEARKGKIAIVGQYTSTNYDSNFDMHLTTGTGSLGEQVKRVTIKAEETKVGIGTSSPFQTLDVNGTTHLRGSERINMVGDSSALTLRYSTSQTTPILDIENSAGTTLGYLHIFNPASNPSFVFGRVVSVNATSANNTVFGNSSAVFTAGAGNNTFVGFNNAGASYNGYENTHIGAYCGRNTTNGYQNVLIGYLAGGAVTTGYQNMFVGRRAGENTTTGQGNTAIGATSLNLNISGSANVAIGTQAAQKSTGNSNVVIGGGAFVNNTSGDGNVIIGAEVLSAATGVSNRLAIDNSNTTSPLISGDFTNNYVGINTLHTAIAANLHITSASGATAKMVRIENTTGSNDVYRSNATPESAITGNPGDLCLTSVSSTGKLFIKRTGTGNTGWIESSPTEAGQYNADVLSWDPTNSVWDAVNGNRFGSFFFTGTATVTDGSTTEFIADTTATTSTLNLNFTPDGADFPSTGFTNVRYITNFGSGALTVQTNQSWKFRPSTGTTSTLTIAAGEAWKLIWRYDATAANCKFYAVKLQ